MADHQAHRPDRDQEPAPSAPRGNRPAEHARHATPSSLLASSQWQGNEAAGDFLGLDSELGGLQAAAAIPPPPVAPQRAPAAAQRISAPTRAIAEPETAVERTWLDEMPDAQEQEEVEVAPEAELDAELLQPAVLETAWTEAATRRGTPSWVGWAGGAVAACALAFGVVRWMGSRESGEPVETAAATYAPKSTPVDSTAPAVAVITPPPAETTVAPEAELIASPVMPEPSVITPEIEPATEPSVRVALGAELEAPLPDEPFESSDPVVAAREPAHDPVESSAWDQTAIEDYVPQYPIGHPVTPEPINSTAIPVESQPLAQAPIEQPEPVAVVPEPSTPPVAVVQTPAPAPVPVKSESELAAAAAADAEWAMLVNNLANASKTEPGTPPTPAWAQPGALAGAPQATPADGSHQTAGIGSSVGPQHGEAHPPSGGTHTPGVVASGPSAQPMGPPVISPNAPNEPSASARRATQLAPDEVVVPKNSSQTGVRPAAARDLATMWNGDTIPFEALGNPAKMLTPNVGQVRVMLKSNEIFEGRLYAMGEGCVWLDGAYGRMGLEGSRVDKVERLSGPAGTPELGAKGSQALTGLDRVRIKTPGGIFFGKILTRDALKTTLITDDGAKLTLDTKDVEYLGKSPKTIVVKKK